jgi:hypothetical protein
VIKINCTVSKTEACIVEYLHAFLRSVEARRVSVTAMVLLLSNSTVIGTISKIHYSLSQSWACSQTIGGIESQPAPETETDVLGSSDKNESVCFEVLSILKRFFSLQVEVREHLYLGKNLLTNMLILKSRTKE